MATSPLSSIGTVLETFEHSADTVAGNFATSALVILTGCIAIRLARTGFEAVFDDSLVGWMEDFIYVVIIATVLTMGIKNHAQLAAMAWGLMDAIMPLMDTSTGHASSGGANGLIEWLYDSAMKTIQAVWGAAVIDPTAAKACGAVDLACKFNTSLAAVADSIVSVLILALILLGVLIYMLLMMVQVFTGIFMIAIGLAFLPLCLAFYPLIESWAKNAVGLIASGIAHMGIVAFLLSLVTTVTNQIVLDFVNTTPDAMTGPYAAMMGRAIILLTLVAFLIVLALASGKAIGFATSIFGSVSGMVGSLKGGGGGGGGSKNTSASTGGGAGAGAAASSDVGGGGAGAGAAAAAEGSATARAGAAVKAGASSVVTAGAAAAKAMAHQMLNNK